jgi:hypothetical protein
MSKLLPISPVKVTACLLGCGSRQLAGLLGSVSRVVSTDSFITMFVCLFVCFMMFVCLFVL